MKQFLFPLIPVSLTYPSAIKFFSVQLDSEREVEGSPGQTEVGLTIQLFTSNTYCTLKTLLFFRVILAREVSIEYKLEMR